LYIRQDRSLVASLNRTKHPFAEQVYISHLVLPARIQYTPLLFFSDRSLILLKQLGSKEDLLTEPCIIKWKVNWENIRDVRVRRTVSSPDGPTQPKP
jgi:hypothetical protein